MKKTMFYTAATLLLAAAIPTLNAGSSEAQATPHQSTEQFGTPAKEKRKNDRKTYESFIDPENCRNLDWSAFDFRADNGDKLPEIVMAEPYDDSAYDSLRDTLLPRFDKSDKDFSGEYYTGDFKISLKMYTFNMNINAWLNNSSSVPQLSTPDAIRWAAEAGFDAVDLTCYYIPPCPPCPSRR